MVDFTWLPDRNEASVREALALVAPKLTVRSFVASPKADESNPMWWSSSAVVNDDLFVKFAWSEPAGRRLFREVLLLDVLAARTEDLRLPAVAFSSTMPVLVATNKVGGASLSHEAAQQLDKRAIARVAEQRAGYLAALHAPSVLEAVWARGVPLAGPVAQADTDRLRADFPAVVTGRRGAEVVRWCDWVDRVLSGPAPAVLLHGDLHLHNELWDDETFTLEGVVDYEHGAIGDASFDFRYLPREYDVFIATVAEYDRLMGESLDVERVMAWHILTSLGDALWRSEAGFPMPAGAADPDQWFDLVADRLERLGINPRRRPPPART